MNSGRRKYKVKVLQTSLAYFSSKQIQLALSSYLLSELYRKKNQPQILNPAFWIQLSIPVMNTTYCPDLASEML